MAKIYRTKIWQVKLPKGWSAWTDSQQREVTFFRPDGVGLLTIFTPEEHTVESQSRSRRAHAHGLHDSTKETVADGFRQTWAFSCQGRELYIRYVCATHYAGKEDKEVERIVQSLQETDSEE